MSRVERYPCKTNVVSVLFCRPARPVVESYIREMWSHVILRHLTRIWWDLENCGISPSCHCLVLLSSLSCHRDMNIYMCLWYYLAIDHICLTYVEVRHVSIVARHCCNMVTDFFCYSSGTFLEWRYLTNKVQFEFENYTRQLCTFSDDIYTNLANCYPPNVRNT